MRRYVRDPRLREFHEKIRDEVRQVSAVAGDGAYVIYAIRDPTNVDLRRNHKDGPPIYVGQTREIANRANSHMRDGGESYASNRCKAGILKSIMTKWRVPKFDVLDTAPTHLTSLIAETTWARRFVWLGYELANKWSEHTTSEPPQGLLSVPMKRLWSLTVREAIQDEVSVRLECRPCGLNQPLDLAALRDEAPLRSLRSLRLTCSACGTNLLRITPPDPSSWRWAAYAPAPISR